MSVAFDLTSGPYDWITRLSDDDLRALNSAVQSAFFLRFRKNVGTRPLKPDSRVARLMRMQVGETIMFEDGSRPNCGKTIELVRKRLNCLEFNVRSTMTNKGCRVTRVA